MAQPAAHDLNCVVSALVHESEPAQDRAQNLFCFFPVTLQSCIRDRDGGNRTADFQIFRSAEDIISFARETYRAWGHGANGIDQSFSQNLHTHRFVSAQSYKLNVFDVEPLGLKDRFSGELVGAADALRTDALAAQVIHRFDVRFRDQAMQRLVGQHRDNFERHALHGAGDDIAEAQGVMHFAAHQRRHRHLAAHLNQQGFEILIFEKPSRHSHLRRQKGVAPATVGDNYFVRRVGRVQRPKGKGDGNSEPVANFHTRLFTSW